MTTTDPRWENERISRRRADSQVLAVQFSDDDKAKMLVHLEGELRSYGISTITEDLVLLLWGGLPLALDFIATSIRITCANPHCAYSSFSHAATGIDTLGVILLILEDKIGQAL